MNIHLGYTKELYAEAILVETELKSLAPNNQIDFFKTMNPHVTLYLTDFQDSFTGIIQQKFVC
jgi:hypothetical protein